MSLDPLAADFVAWSPYNYVLGNPVRLVDPDGKAPETGGPPIEALPSILIATVNSGFRQLFHKASRNLQIAFGADPKAIPYKEFGVELGASGFTFVSYIEHKEEPSTSEQVLDSVGAIADVSGVLPGAELVTMMAKPPGGPVVSEIISEVAQVYKNLQCVECATNHIQTR